MKNTKMSWVSAVVLLFVVAMLMLGHDLIAGMFQEPKPIELTEIQKLKIKSAYKDYQLHQQQLDNLILQFISTNKEAMRIKAEMSLLNDELDQTVAGVYTDLKLDQSKWKINPEDGSLVPTPRQPGQPGEQNAPPTIPAPTVDAKPPEKK